jgi:hypothetical protein
MNEGWHTEWLFAEMRLVFLRNFLEHIMQNVGTEWDDIEKRRENGDLSDYGDYEQAMDFPLFREDIASRAVLYELNALVESQLHAIARPLWLRSVYHKGPKHIQDLSSITTESLKTLKMVSDLPMKEIITLIEMRYNITLDSIDGWSAFIELRSKVNAFKHRDGRKHFKEIDWEETHPLKEPLYKAHFDDAEMMLKQIAVLLKNLRRLTKPEK